MKSLRGKRVTITACHHVAEPGNISRLIGKTGTVTGKRENHRRRCDEYEILFDGEKDVAWYAEDQFTVIHEQTTEDIENFRKVYADLQSLKHSLGLAPGSQNEVQRIITNLEEAIDLLPTRDVYYDDEN